MTTLDVSSELRGAPAVTKKRGTILNVADVLDNERIAEDAQFEFSSLSCMTIDGEPNFCAANTKTLTQGPGDAKGFRFGLYGGVNCKTVGWDSLGLEDGIEAVWEDAEAVGVEMLFMRTRFRARAQSWAAPTDITPASGAVKPKEAVARLEGHAGANYHFEPTLHMPREIASLVAGDLDWWRGDALVTTLGSKIAAGGGYDKLNTSPAGAAPAVGEYWMYATGAVRLRRSALIRKSAVNTSNNERPVFFERAYMGSVDCYAAAIRVTRSA
jgi:hypothetical protein